MADDPHPDPTDTAETRVAHMAERCNAAISTTDEAFMTPSPVLLTLTVSEDGEIRAYPGVGFTPEHMELLTEMIGSVTDALKVL